MRKRDEGGRDNKKDAFETGGKPSFEFEKFTTEGMMGNSVAKGDAV